MLRKFSFLIIFLFTVLTTRSQNHRLIATQSTKFSNGSWVNADTSCYIYLGNFGGGYDEYILGTLRSDTSNYFEWNGSTYEPSYRIIKTLNGQGWIMEELWLSINGSIVTNDYKDIYTRDGNGNITEEVSLYWDNNMWNNNMRFLRTFDNNNNMLWEERQDGTTTTWTPYKSEVFQYDINDNLVRASYSAYNTGTNQFDSLLLSLSYYNSDNLVDSTLQYQWAGGWQPNHKHSYSYDLNDNLIHSLSMNRVNNNWQNLTQRFTLMTNNIPSGDSNQVWIANTNTWRNQYRGKSTLDNNNRRIEYHLMSWDVNSNLYKEVSIDTTEYNSDGLVSRTKQLSWDFNTLTWGLSTNRDTRFYYETYTSGINNLNKPPACVLLVYPTVTYGSLNISAKWENASDFKVAIYDIQGRLVRQWSEKPIKDYHRNIPVNDLSAGTYILKISSRESSAQAQFIIAE